MEKKNIYGAKDVIRAEDCYVVRFGLYDFFAMGNPNEVHSDDKDMLVLSSGNYLNITSDKRVKRLAPIDRYIENSSDMVKQVFGYFGIVDEEGKVKSLINIENLVRVEKVIDGMLHHENQVKQNQEAAERAIQTKKALTEKHIMTFDDFAKTAKENKTENTEASM